MKKFVFGVFTLLAVGLCTSPLFAKYCEKVPECASGCSYMQSCYTDSPSFDIYDCGGSYTAVRYWNWKHNTVGNCENCIWNVKMKDGKFIVDSRECKAR